MTVPEGSLRASRVRKARGESCCGLCGAPVLVGNWIGLIEDKWWCHVTCVIERNAAAAAARQNASLPSSGEQLDVPAIGGAEQEGMT